MNQATEFALRTWYPKDHELHKDLEPALLGLIGEAGEVCEVVKKAKYKYQKPIDRDVILEELGDYWYYLRVVAYILDVELVKFGDIHKSDVADLCMNLAESSTSIYSTCAQPQPMQDLIMLFVNCAFTELCVLLDLFNCTLDDLTFMNYEKLRGGRHGWEENTVKIFGSEIDFVLEVPQSELMETIKDIWLNPNNYYECIKQYYDFLKFLWVGLPEGEKRLAYIAEENNFFA